ncbi:molybdate ABC transporter substrate-binding protein [Oscillochloris sp. ZM17-4]|uniref:molybdate ABC transporter substrate-binding protein n=1 Tax=Oscillochloris sp. ZM17-4 TaxID=2866714 RepID=UPI001C73934E|nr:molybdate ABC transporter substrate-binding protein [Oscillochloris sp. ZM17-4]MBX0327894.1 molybdate ABC transporter substrate-binding protein [Oscillochloris sp. ZM17-4]
MSPRRQSPLTIELALLGFISQQPMHAYAAYQQLTAPDALGRIWQLKLSHFYALASKLERAGYLATELEPQGARPPRKVLRVTEAGAAAFANWLATPVDDPAQLRLDFLARLYFAERAGPAAVRSLLAAQRAAGRAWRDAMRAQLLGRAGQPDAGLFLQLRIRQLESFLAWLDRTLAAPPEASAVSFSIAMLADCAQADLATDFVDAVRGPAGQAALLHAGFYPTVAAFLESAPLDEPAPVRMGERTLTVFAAASLTGPFHAIGADFCAAHPGAALRFVFDGSYALSARLSRGETADIFAPAHRQAMDLAVHAGRVWRESVYAFASNQIAVVALRSNPTRITRLDDLARPGIRLALGSEATAIGQYTQEFLSQVEGRGFFGTQGKDAVLHNVVRYGESITEVLESVTCGEADAGIVFASDGRQADGDIYVPIALPILG